MAKTDNPLDPIEKKVLRIQTRLMDFTKLLFGKIKPMAGTLAGLIGTIQKSAKELGAKIGKSIVDKFLKAAQRALRLVPILTKLVQEGIKRAVRLRAIILKAVKEPSSIFKVVKTAVARLAKLFRTVVAQVAELMAMIDPVETVLGMVNSMKMMLQFVFDWVKDVSPVAGLAKKARTMLLKSVKMLKAEAKELTKLVKEANALKPA